MTSRCNDSRLGHTLHDWRTNGHYDPGLRAESHPAHWDHGPPAYEGFDERAGHSPRLRFREAFHRVNTDSLENNGQGGAKRNYCVDAASFITPPSSGGSRSAPRKPATCGL